MKSIRSFLVSFVALASVVQAEDDPTKLYKFITRPDLKAPKWNVTIHAPELVSPGYWFVAPYEQIGQTEPGQAWIGPHIYDYQGELIWSGVAMFGNMSVQDFRISNLRGQNVMSLIRPERNSAVLLNDRFEAVHDVWIDDLNMHELNFVDDGKRALVVTEWATNASVADSRATGLEEGLCEALFQTIQELDTETWQPVGEWSTKDHVELEETTFKYGPASDRCAQGTRWDYLHANAADKCPDGDLLVSARHTDAIYKISRFDGSIVWRLGGLRNDFLKSFNFSRQHHVRCLAQNETHTKISFLDNAKGDDPQEPSSALSRGLIVALEPETKHATLLARYDHPHGEAGYAYRRGGLQMLDGGNVFISWSEQGLHSEHTADGVMVLEANLKTEWLGTYRSYKFPFTGHPSTPPDVYAHTIVTPDMAVTDIFASWNGATEVSSWKVYETDENGGREVLIAWTPRVGFETGVSFDGFARYVSVEALNVEGEILGRSKVFETLEAFEENVEKIAGFSSLIKSRPEANQSGNAFASWCIVTMSLVVLVCWVWCRRHRGFDKDPWHWLRDSWRSSDYEPLLGKEC